MKAILYEAGEVISEEERIYRERDGEDLPLWYKQVPETQAEKALLTYAIEGLLGGSMEVDLRHDKHKQCRATLALGDWTDEGILNAAVIVTHALSSKEQQSVSEQLQRWHTENKQSSGIEPPLFISSYPITLTPEDFPFGDYEETSPSSIEEKSFIEFSILFPSEEGKVTGWFRVLLGSPSTPHASFAVKVDEVEGYVKRLALPLDHFHYHNPFSSRDADNRTIDKNVPSNHDDRYEDWFNGLSSEDRNNMDMND